MIFYKKPLAVMIGHAFGTIAVMSMAQVALAQTATTIQRVEVTGSNIKRTESETASPVQVLTRDDIERAGKSTVADLLQSLAVDNQGSVPKTFGSGFSQGGASGISLRGMGAQATLVLIDGRRMAPYALADDGYKAFGDLNIIPSEAVERIEILKDGASSIYGSDAIAGVVNVILRKNFVGTVGKVEFGTSRYRDGNESKVAVTHGFGKLETDRFNVLLNIEASGSEEIWNRDRGDRKWVGSGDWRDYGYSARVGLGGYKNSANSVSANPIGWVRNPATSTYQLIAGGNCAAISNVNQSGAGSMGPNGGCLVDNVAKYGMIQPEQKTLNFFARGTFQIAADLQGYAEFLRYEAKSFSSSTPSNVHGTTGFPGGVVDSSGVSFGALHPQNPFGAAARVRYLAADVGPRTGTTESEHIRFVAGLKGTGLGWDWDTAFLHSESTVDSKRTGFLQRDVLYALLAGTYAPMPGVYYLLGPQAGLNSAALYAALSPAIGDHNVSKIDQIDFKASRDLMQLPGGAMSLAVGAEVRKEMMDKQATSGTEIGNITGLGYSGYQGSRTIKGVYAEILAPVHKTVELSLALRHDTYSDAGSSTTPKIGAKWTPVKQIALRSTYAEGFRAPSAAENGKGGVAAFAVAQDPVRCAIDPLNECGGKTIGLIYASNPNLKPEKSKSHTFGFVLDPLPGTSVSVDWWSIRRNNEILQGGDTQTAINAGNVLRDNNLLLGVPGSGNMLVVMDGFRNADHTVVRGVDLDATQRFNLGENGKLTFNLQYTNLKSWKQTIDSVEYDLAGANNSNPTNMMGMPKHRFNFTTTWEKGNWMLSAKVDYRGKFQNLNDAQDVTGSGCQSHFADGTDAPSGCTIDSFTTVDASARWKMAKNTEIYGGIRNVFDKIPPLNPATYGANGYTPSDYSGAVGRYFRIGLKYKF